MAPTGSTDTRLVVIRGNSGSGKTCLARAIRDARPRGVAIVAHDVLRRDILNVADHPGALSVEYIDLSARFALDHGLHVVIDCILHSESYGDMLTRLCRDHRGTTRCYRYDPDRTETLRRHRTKILANHVSETRVESWYRHRDPVDGLPETAFGAEVSLHQALQTVLSEAGWASTSERLISAPDESISMEELGPCGG